MINFLKKIYFDLYEIPDYYLNINDKLFNHVFTFFIIVLAIIIIISNVKEIIEIIKLKKENKLLQRKIDKHLLSLIGKKYKKEKKKNIFKF